MRNITTNMSAKIYAGAYSRVHVLINSPRKHASHRGLALLEYAMLAGIAVGGFILIDKFMLRDNGGGFITKLTTKIECQFDKKTTC